MNLLDLCCCAGGGAEGYQRAGFTEIIGVDIEPQPNYPFAFHQGDALELLRELVPTDFDAIHASFPCQAFTAYRRKGHGVGDLNRCERTYEAAPPHLRARMTPTLLAFRELVEADAQTRAWLRTSLAKDHQPAALTEEDR